MPPNSLAAWLDYLASIHHSAIDLSLCRIIEIARDLSLTQFDCRVITVAGTNGKGSCVATLEHIYHSSGYRVGAYTSPQLIQFNERIRVDKISVEDHALLAAFELIEKQRVRLGITLSFFEFTTLTALWIFQQANLDVLILEVGLGGRLDAVNVVEYDVGIITSIALDHMDWLGNTREAIGREKAGIARANKPLICGDPNPPLTVGEVAVEKGAELIQINCDFQYDVQDDVLHWRRGQHEITAIYPVELFPQNMACALTAIHCLQPLLPVTKKTIEGEMQQIRLPGRHEVVSRHPMIMLDVAHNPAAVQWLVSRLNKACVDKPIYIIFGVMRDKAIHEMIRLLEPIAHSWGVVDLATERAEKASVLAQMIKTQSDKNCYTFASVADALSTFISEAACIVVCGSFYTVAAAKIHLTKEVCEWN